MKNRSLMMSVSTLGVLLFVSHTSWASKPRVERSLESCRESVSLFGRVVQSEFSSSSLIPLSQLLGTRHCLQIAKNHLEGQMQNRLFPSQGLAQMYLAAKTAADELVDDLQMEAIRPSFPHSSLVQGAEETLRLMLEDQPEFIREAVLIRDGVVMVIPLLRRDGQKTKTTKPLYLPVIVKGHQELGNVDVMATAFAAWALGEYLGKIPKQGFVYLKPMVKKRVADKTSEWERMYRVNVEALLPAVYQLHQKFFNTISHPEELRDVKPRRCTQCTICPWAPYCRQILSDGSDLSMMPTPPKKEEAERLSELGFGKMTELAKLDINSPIFVEASVYSGIPPERLRFMVAHSLATLRDRPLLVEKYENPLSLQDTVLHIDFEDLVDRDLNSGVYLFGMELERKSKSLEKKFIFAKSLSQESVDEAWAEFIRYTKTQRWLKKGDFKITTYTKHELVKFKQEFDIFEGELDEFTFEQKQSPFFSGVNSQNKALGRLIRNTSFFKTYPDLSPKYIFQLMDAVVDLHEFTRKNFAFPTHSNSLKLLLPYIMKDLKMPLDYPAGWNGLQSIAWAREAYQTGEVEKLEQIRAYNEIDVSSDYYVTKFLRRHQRDRVSFEIRFTEERRQTLSEIRQASQARATLYNLDTKRKILADILGESLSDLSASERQELLGIIDRSPYLESRKLVLDDKTISGKAEEEALQRLKFADDQERKAKLLSFFKKVRKSEILEDEISDKIAELFFKASNYLIPSNIYEILALEKMRKIALKRPPAIPKNLARRLRVPPYWSSLGETLTQRSDFQEVKLPDSEIRSLWDALYYERAFRGLLPRSPGL